MPLYEYRCKKCEHLEEVLQKAKDPAPAKCPECGAKKSMAKEVSLTSFQLKGGGWYSDLYGSTKPESDSGDKSDKTAAKADKKSDAGKTDSQKSDAKSDSKKSKSDAKKSGAKSSKSPKGSKAA